MAYVGLDTMAFLSIPREQASQTRRDFINWVDTYLVGDPVQIYQYRGTDVYGARCAMLHTFGSKTTYHEQHPETFFYAYHDGGRHMHDPAVNPRLVMIGTASFLNDIHNAMVSFMDACINSEELRLRVEPRLAHVLNTIPLPAP